MAKFQTQLDMTFAFNAIAFCDGLNAAEFAGDTVNCDVITIAEVSI